MNPAPATINPLLQNAKLLRDREAAELLAMSRSTLWAKSSDPDDPLPAPTRRTGSPRWRLADLIAYLDGDTATGPQLPERIRAKAS